MAWLQTRRGYRSAPETASEAMAFALWLDAPVIEQVEPGMAVLSV